MLDVILNKFLKTIYIGIKPNDIDIYLKLCLKIEFNEINL